MLLLMLSTQHAEHACPPGPRGASNDWLGQYKEAGFLLPLPCPPAHQPTHLLPHLIQRLLLQGVCHHAVLEVGYDRQVLRVGLERRQHLPRHLPPLLHTVRFEVRHALGQRPGARRLVKLLRVSGWSNSSPGVPSHSTGGGGACTASATAHHRHLTLHAAFSAPPLYPLLWWVRQMHLWMYDAASSHMAGTCCIASLRSINSSASSTTRSATHACALVMV